MPRRVASSIMLMSRPKMMPLAATVRVGASVPVSVPVMKRVIASLLSRVPYLVIWPYMIPVVNAIMSALSWCLYR